MEIVDIDEIVLVKYRLKKLFYKYLGIRSSYAERNCRTNVSKHSTIHFREIMDSSKILLVNLTKGKLGDMNMALLGMLVVGKLLNATFSRVDQPEEKRKDFYPQIAQIFADFLKEFIIREITSL